MKQIEDSIKAEVDSLKHRIKGTKTGDPAVLAGGSINLGVEGAVDKGDAKMLGHRWVGSGEPWRVVN